MTQLLELKILLQKIEQGLLELGLESFKVMEIGCLTEKEAFEAWFSMIKQRYPFHVNKISLNKHPQFIREKLSNLQAGQFGHSLFGLKDNTRFSIKNKFNQKKIKLKYKI